MFADFCGVNIPTEDNFKLPTLNTELGRNVHPGLHEPGATCYCPVLHDEIQLIEKNLHFLMIMTMNKHAMV